MPSCMHVVTSKSSLLDWAAGECAAGLNVQHSFAAFLNAEGFLAQHMLSSQKVPQ